MRENRERTNIVTSYVALLTLTLGEDRDAVLEQLLGDERISDTDAEWAIRMAIL